MRTFQRLFLSLVAKLKEIADVKWRGERTSTVYALLPCDRCEAWHKAAMHAHTHTQNESIGKWKCSSHLS